jgi:hypothetical protein
VRQRLTSPTPTGGEERRPPRPFRAATWLARGLIGLLVVDIALAWVRVQATLHLAHVVWQVLARELPGPTTVTGYGRQLALLGRLQDAAALLTAGCFLAWLARVTANLPALGTTVPAHTARQAIAAFLVPVVNLIRPLAVVRAVWAGSVPPPVATLPLPRGGIEPPMLAWWWGLLLAWVAAELARWATAGRMGPAGLRGSLILVLLGEGLGIAAAVLTIVVVLGIDGNQTERFRRRAAAGSGCGAALDARDSS